MAIPRSRNPIAQRKSRSQIEEAVKVASGMQTPGVTREEGSPQKPSSLEKNVVDKHVEPTPSSPSAPKETSARRPGRPALKEGRTERVTAWMTQATRRRLKMALFGEQAKRQGTTGDVDQSLIIEEALEKWLTENNY